MRIVFFDGHCSLCNGVVNWLLRKDKSGELKFASLQGETAAQFLVGEIHPLEQDTVIYFRDGEKFKRSTAVLRILSDLGGSWAGARFLLFVPARIRDGLYGLVARNRFRFFKRLDICRTPSPSERGRLLP